MLTWFRIIAYDIACDRRRRQMQQLAQSVAERVQDSVFEGWLSDREVADLLRRARPLIEPATDSLRIYLLCESCREQAHCLGAPITPPPPDDILT